MLFQTRRLLPSCHPLLPVGVSAQAKWWEKWQNNRKSQRGERRQSLLTASMAALKWTHSSRTSWCTQEATFVTGPVRPVTALKALVQEQTLLDGQTVPLGWTMGLRTMLKPGKAQGKVQGRGFQKGHHFPASKFPLPMHIILTFHFIFTD